MKERRVHNPILSQIRTTIQELLPSRSWDFVYNPMGGVQLLYTKLVTHSFSMEGCKYSNTYNLSTANHIIFRRQAFPTWNFQHIKPCFQQVIKISHAHDENALYEPNSSKQTVMHIRRIYWRTIQSYLHNRNDPANIFKI